MARGLRFFTQRVGDGAGQPLLDADNGEELMRVQTGVSIVLANRSPESPGKLYISTKQLVWLSDTDREKGYAVDFLSVSLHAVSRDPEAYPSPCIYCQKKDFYHIIKPQCCAQGVAQMIETEGEDDELEGSDAEFNETLDISKITELRLVPPDPSQLDALFEIFCECAELNPEPIEEEEHDWVFSADQMEDHVLDEEDSEWNATLSPTSAIGCSNGDHDLTRHVLELQINDQRFEDAEEMESGDNRRHQ